MAAYQVHDHSCLSCRIWATNSDPDAQVPARLITTDNGTSTQHRPRCKGVSLSGSSFKQKRLGSRYAAEASPMAATRPMTVLK